MPRWSGWELHFQYIFWAQLLPHFHSVIQTLMVSQRLRARGDNMGVETRIFSSINWKKICSFSASLLSKKNLSNQYPFIYCIFPSFSCCTAMHLSSSYPLTSPQCSLPTTNFHSYILSPIETLTKMPHLCFHSIPFTTPQVHPVTSTANIHGDPLCTLFRNLTVRLSMAGSLVD